jgi:hypothetical protein
MAFLDNSGDIILDAVLTDTGRLRMAQGDGSFRITKFALGDDEINYGLYNKDHLSGSAYYDLEVLQTPVLEAFTNNTSNLKTKLVTMSRTNVLYMPVLKINPRAIENETSSQFFSRRKAGSEDASAEDTPYVSKFYVAVDSDTFLGIQDYRDDADIAASTATPHQHASPDVPTHGVIQGYTAGEMRGSMIRVDHGLDTTEISVGQGVDTDLVENAFIVELDYRLGRIKQRESSNIAPVNFIDDDNIATYYLAGTNWVDDGPASTNNIPPGTGAGQLGNLPNENPQVFGDGQGTGPRGNSLKFRIQASQELQQSKYLFEQLGTSQDLTSAGGNQNVAGLPLSSKDKMLNALKDKKLHYIDSTVRIIGANTGYRIDIPIRFVKLT